MSIIIEPKKQPEVMASLQRLSLAQALHMEVNFGMKLSSGINALQVAKRYGFKGTRKVAALKWAIQRMRDEGDNIPTRLLAWDHDNPA